MKKTKIRGKFPHQAWTQVSDQVDAKLRKLCEDHDLRRSTLMRIMVATALESPKLEENIGSYKSVMGG